MTVSALSVTAGSAAAATRLTVSGIDTVGYPYVDLILGGVPGLGIGEPPPITVTQGGQRLRATTSWALSAGQPLAVVMDAPRSQRSSAQGIVGELVQAMPPEVPLSLASATTGRATTASINRDAFMTDLSRQPVDAASSVSRAIAGAAAAGIQHVFVLSTCASPPPTPAPVGVIVDVLAVGASCDESWRAGLASGAGGYTSASDAGSGLAALDAMVAAWRSSVVVVAQVSSRLPLVLQTGTARVTASLVAPSSWPGPGAATAGGSADGLQSAASSTPASGTPGRVLGLGLLLLVLAVGLAALVWDRRHSRGQHDAGTPVPTSAPVRWATEPDHPGPHTRPQPGPAPTQPPAQPPSPQPASASAASVAPRPVRALPRPRVVDLRDHPTEVSVERPEEAPRQIALDDAGMVLDDTTIMPLMAVAAPAPVGEADRSEPATVAEPDEREEPATMAEEQPGPETDDTDREASDVMVADESESAEPVEDAGVEDAVADQAPEASDEQAADETVDASADQAADESTDQAADEPEPAAGDAEFKVASEFSWSALEFTPLVWRYDAEPTEPSEIDLREPADVDLREDAGRKQPRRKRARR